MKPDVKKIIADIKATKGNRKYCNGLAGTLQDDNYASSICKYVKTVTPERIDLLIEYTENLEAEVTDMAVQLANAESKCRELAAENAGLKDSVEHAAGCIHAAEVEGLIDALGEKDGERLADLVHRRLCHAYLPVEAPATDAFLAEVRAQGVERVGEYLRQYAQGLHEEARLVLQDAGELCNGFAAQLRKGAAL
ncbi:hypothetical protein [Citrobacter meridianamericanus]|uniref:hypothetical protein n=1 Tax=Citrobacter meridianamericanus TaxID=2894201 RepID=UPI00351D0AB4